MIKNVVAVLGNVQVGETISVIVANGDTLPIAAAGNPSLYRHLSESAIAIVVIKSISQGRVGIKEIAFAAVHEINIHPPVVVIVEKGTTGAGSLGEVMLMGLSADVPPRNPAHFGRNDFEKIWGGRGTERESRETRKGDPTRQSMEELPT